MDFTKVYGVLVDQLKLHGKDKVASFLSGSKVPGEDGISSTSGMLDLLKDQVGSLSINDSMTEPKTELDPGLYPWLKWTETAYHSSTRSLASTIVMGALGQQRGSGDGITMRELELSLGLDFTSECDWLKTCFVNKNFVFLSEQEIAVNMEVEKYICNEN
uniref:Structural protein n=1 Tax=Isavirus salaris TaxID=55987 RepID=A6MST2_9ORTO|nr:non-structural protein 2 [Isavirus salaris]ABR45822.1 p18 kDa protein [Infectious salmon anemia virus]ABG65836.1 non-structural protein 2 [Isavirus salaris]ABG65838.1 non-structural protein 2 [Isavirus salaris]ABG65842.1 non-structural protein 2 [Isavirus salaris]